MNVIMLGPPRTAKGGIASVVSGYLEAGLDERCTLRYIETTSEGSKLSKLRSGMGALSTFKKQLEDADVVHVHMASRVSYERKKVFIKTAYKHGVPVIIHMHGAQWKRYFAEECSESKRKEIKRTFSMATKVIVLSEEWREYFAQHVCDEEKLAIVYNAVKIPPLPENEAQQKEPDNPYILFLGRLDQRKSPDILLRAFAPLAEKYPEWRVHFGGDGLLGKYRQMACDLGVEDRCDFLGWIGGEQKEAELSKSSIFCLPSKDEGLPMSLLEAMARSVAVVSTSVGGIPQVIEDCENGFLVPVDDVEALSKALDKLMLDSTYRKEIGLAGRDKIRETFNIDKVLDQLLEVYYDAAQKTCYNPRCL